MFIENNYDIIILPCASIFNNNIYSTKFNIGNMLLFDSL